MTATIYGTQQKAGCLYVCLLLSLLLSACSPTGAPPAPDAASTAPVVAPSPSSPAPLATDPEPDISHVSPEPSPWPTSYAAPFTPPIPMGPRPREFITATLKTLPDIGQNISASTFLDENHGWVATGTGLTRDSLAVLFATQDGGKTWQLLESSNGAITWNLSFVSPELGWRSYSLGLVHQTRDGGQTWLPISLGMGQNCAGNLQFIDAQHGWAITCGFSLLRTQDGGQSWNPLPSPPVKDYTYWRAIDFVNPEHGWAIVRYAGVPNQVLIIETLNGGETWRTVFDPQQQPLEGSLPTDRPYDLSFVDAQHGWMSSLYRFYATQDGGKTWQPIKTGTPNRMASILAIDHQRGFAVVNAPGTWRDALVKTADGGQSWTQIYPALSPIGDLQFFDGQQGIGIGAANDWGAILKTSDGGRSWKKISTLGPIIEAVNRLSFADPQHGWVSVEDCFGQDGCGKTALYGTADGGLTWERISAADFSTAGYSFVERVTPAVGYALAAGQGYRSSDAGQTFEQVPGMDGLKQVTFADALHGWGLARSNLLSTVDGGANWKPLPLGATPDHINFLPGGVGWVTGRSCVPTPCQKVLLQTLDNGQTWKGFILPNLYIETLRMSTAQDGWLRGGEHPVMKGGHILGVDHLYVTHDGGYTWVQVR